MDTLRIDTGLVQLLINEGPDHIEFNPTEVNWGRRYEKLRISLKNGMNENLEKLNGVEKKTNNLIEERFKEETNGRSLSKEEMDNIKKTIEVAIEESQEIIDLKEEVNCIRDDMCLIMRNEIDGLFGKGVSQKVFGNLMSEYAIVSFLECIAPYIQSGREKMVTKYMPKGKRNKHKVM